MRTELERLADVIANAPTYPYEAAKVIHAAGYRLVAPVTGDRETAGVDIRALSAADDAFDKWRWTHSEGMALRDAFRAGRASATPPSGGGDHAGGGELKAALEPFAEAAEGIDKSVPDNASMWESPAAMSLSAGDFRRALAAFQDYFS